MKLIPWLLVVVLLVACGGTPTPLPGSMVITEPIRMELVRVPAGEFLMGSDPTNDSMPPADERPQHQVKLAEFFVGRYEVTNAQSAEFVKATGYHEPGDPPFAPDDWENWSGAAGKEDHPVVYVSWNDATAFAQWLGEESGMAFRLCTEAEWEKACRGESGLIYPWGDAFDASRANSYKSGIVMISPVGAYSPAGDSPYGVADTTGNAWEWTSSLYGPYPYTSIVEREDLEAGPRVLRGGAFYFSVDVLRCAARFVNFPNYSYSVIGFRVCASP